MAVRDILQRTCTALWFILNTTLAIMDVFLVLKTDCLDLLFLCLRASSQMHTDFFFHQNISFMTRNT